MKNIPTFENFVNENEDINELNESLKVGDFVRFKRGLGNFSGGKIVSISGGNATVKNWDGSETEFKLSELEYVQSWNESVNEDAHSIEKIEQDIKMIMSAKISNSEKDKKIASLEKTYRQHGGKKTLGQIESEIKESIVNENEKWVLWTQDPGQDKKKYGEYSKKEAFTALNNVGARYYDNDTEVGIMKIEDWKKEGNK